MPINDIRIVLVEPNHPGNIGAVARAMKTMALSDLALVRPVDFPSHLADRRSMGAKDLLDKARVFESLEEAIGDCRLVIGSSARERSFPHSILEPRECAARLVGEAADGEPTALVFGPERTGLANRELDQCTFQVRIPANEAFSSLNLGAAVQLLCYEIFMASRTPVEALASTPKEKPSLQIEMEHFYAHLERALDARGYLEGEMREVTLSKLRRLFNRGRPHSGELKLLHTMLKMIHNESE
jgi:tRNA (cytidine32/uridine32-2'-O)-methyltransferase